MPTTKPYQASHTPLELWGGLECTLNRVGDEYFDQFEWSGHYERAADLEEIAALGIRTLRYPILWERVAPDNLRELHWWQVEERVNHLRELDITPIAGLTHHGSGPRYTDLLDPCYPEKLATYARAVAERFPWIEYYTPVNEPLTTARFSALYGHWYPHRCDDASFLRALINQCRGIMLAMREIRRVNPAAKLVQTEDMGYIRSTPALAYQADFENERRWLSYDFLCGRVDTAHPMAGYLRWSGLNDEEWLPLQEAPCLPDIIGLNYYLTSERFLDERLENYSGEFHGGNGRDAYADVAAVRACKEGIAGAGAILQQAWERYRLPLAITEAHLGCTREEQARWLWEVWNHAHDARRTGADVRAVCAWALLGSYNWNTLVTHDAGFYEPGVFDLRGGQLHSTLLCRLVSDLCEGRRPFDPIYATPGWWRQSTRFCHPPTQAHQRGDDMCGNSTILSNATSLRKEPSRKKIAPRLEAHPFVITGATGTLGNAFARACRLRHLPFHLSSRAQLDITDRSSIEAALDEWQPCALINTAGYVRVDDAEENEQTCMRENSDGAALLAEACAARGISLVTFSSDLVFDGEQSTPYAESDVPSPLNVYGRSKADAERRVLEAHPQALVVRTSAFFGPWDEYNFATLALRVLEAGDEFVAANDIWISPTYVPDLVHAALDLLVDGAEGIWHLANEGEVTWAQFARQIARGAGADESLLQEKPGCEMGWRAPRPRYCVLATERSLKLPTLDSAVQRYLCERAEYLTGNDEDAPRLISASSS